LVQDRGGSIFPALRGFPPHPKIFVDRPALLGLTPRAANGLINDLERLDILKEITGFKRNRVYVFEEYLRLFGK
jgi:hypothetical protein